MTTTRISALILSALLLPAACDHAADAPEPETMTISAALGEEAEDYPVVGVDRPVEVDDGQAAWCRPACPTFAQRLLEARSDSLSDADRAALEALAAAPTGRLRPRDLARAAYAMADATTRNAMPLILEGHGHDRAAEALAALPRIKGPRGVKRALGLVDQIDRQDVFTSFGLYADVMGEMSEPEAVLDFGDPGNAIYDWMLDKWDGVSGGLASEGFDRETGSIAVIVDALGG